MTIDDDLDYMECRQMQRAQESRENIRKNIEDGLTFTTGGGIVAASAAFGFHVGKAATAKEQERTGKKPESHHTEALSHGLGLAIVLTAAYK